MSVDSDDIDEDVYLILGLLDGELRSNSPEAVRARWALVFWLHELWEGYGKPGAELGDSDSLIHQRLSEALRPGRHLVIGELKDNDRELKKAEIVRCMDDYQQEHGTGTYDSAVKHAVDSLGVSKGTAMRAWSEYKHAKQGRKEWDRAEQQRPKRGRMRSLLQRTALWSTFKKLRNI